MTTPAATVSPFNDEDLDTALGLKDMIAFIRSCMVGIYKERQTRQNPPSHPFTYPYRLSTTMLYHRVLANRKSWSNKAQHVALCRRVNGLRVGLSHSETHR